MVVIGGIGSTALGSVPRSTPRAGGAGFRVGADRAGTAVAATAVSVPGLLDIQEAEGAMVQDREARRHAEDMLDALKELQRERLAGAGGAALGRATVLAGRARDAADPRLRDLQRAVLLRVAVEQARGQVSPASVT